MKNPESWFEPELARAATPPARYYRDPAVLDAEREQIFARTWQLVGRADQIAAPGDYFTATINAEPIVVARGQDGEVRAFFNVCRHRAGPVASGAGNCRRFQCHYHGWTYALDGRLTGVPEFDGVDCFSQNSMGLAQVSVAIWKHLVFVNLAKTAPPLGEVLAPIPEQIAHLTLDDMRMVERRDYLIDCNWKVYVDNYLEGYHLPSVHPSLHRMLDYGNYRVETFRYCSAQHAPIRMQARGDELGEWYGDDENEAYYYWIFPNLMINIYPDNFSTNLIVPVDHKRTLTIFEWYFREWEGEAARERIARMVDFSDRVQQEDIDICVAVQRGLCSRSYDRGRYSVKRENGVHHFHSLLHEYLCGL